jgi:hypothetical protein
LTVAPALAVSLGAAAVVLARAPAPPVSVPPAARLYPSGADAIRALLADAGGVVAFGEIHQDTATANTRSSLARFRDEILPVLAPRASHLIVETWIASGACGHAEARVTADVETTTERPPETENEIVSLLGRAKAAGVAPHILEVTCDEYGVLAGEGGHVDYEKLLAITTRHLEAAVRQAALLPRAPARPLVLVYGGALHNDLHPRPELRAYSFAPSSYALLRGAFREVDLYVPEFAERLPSARQEPWYRVWRHADSTKAVLVPRSDHSAVLVFPRSRPRGGGYK